MKMGGKHVMNKG